MTPYIYAGLPGKVKILAYKQFMNSDIDINPVITIDKIIECICLYFRITEDDLKSKSRKRKFVTPRQISMQFIYSFVNKATLKKTGKYFNRDHSTVIDSLKVVENLYKTDRDFKIDYNNLLKLVHDN